MSRPPDFEELVEAHSAEIFGYLWRLTQDQADAQDCLQETYLRAYRAYGRLDTSANRRAWLYRVATNVALTHLKRRNRESARTSALDTDLIAADPTPGEAAIRRETLAAVAAAVDRLPAQQRASLILRKYQELSYVEIAEALGCSTEAARANVYQAVRKLRGEFGGADHE
jgi:RNA polymerase sigma-70 factor (ECF subfamily)